MYVAIDELRCKNQSSTEDMEVLDPRPLLYKIWEAYVL